MSIFTIPTCDDAISLEQLAGTVVLEIAVLHGRDSFWECHR